MNSSNACTGSIWTDLETNPNFKSSWLALFRNIEIPAEYSILFICQDIHGGGEEGKGAVPATIKRRYLCEYSWPIDMISIRLYATHFVRDNYIGHEYYITISTHECTP